MRIRLIAVGERMPGWVSAGYREYAHRLPRECALTLKEVPLPKRGKRPDRARLRAQEGDKLLAAAQGCRIIALDAGGQAPDSAGLARWLEDWLAGGRDVALLVGGPDGLAPDCLQAAERRWSLSPLTLPHPLVRVVVAEQLYRAWSLINNHPYHRA